MSLSGLEDIATEELLTQAKRGSSEAAGALYTRFHPRIFRYLYYRTGDQKIAEDLTGEVFLRMVKAVRSQQIRTGSFQAWLFQVARNLVIDHFRRANAHPLFNLDENQESAARGLDSTIDFAITCQELARALAHVDELQRDVVLFRFIEGMSLAEVAQVLGKSEDAVKGLQRRGLMALRLQIPSPEMNRT